MRTNRRRGYEGGEKMGVFQAEETHDSRPTGRLFATRWKHEHLRWIVISAILTFAVVVMFNALLKDASAKRVTVVDDGVSAHYRTWSAHVTDFLSEQGIVVGPFDRISVSLAAPLGKSEHIVIERAKQILIQADGQQQVRYTTESTVGEALAELNIRVDDDDRVTPSLDEPIRQGGNIRIVRVRVETIETEHPIAYTVVKQKDNNLEQGKEKVVRTGKTGLLVKRMQRIFEDGKLVREEVLEEEVVRPAVQQIVSVGGKKPVSTTLVASTDNISAAARTLKLNGQTVPVKKILENVTLTAYTAGPESTGKKKDDPNYGITYSGTKVQEGRTIAVDPDVIPLGWWVYIEGIGFRRAEDIGSAVKGNKIDIYYDNESYAKKFGRKKGYTVYVIGPAKPTAN